jgi:hypothetical protein
MTFESDVDVRTREQGDKDELETAKLAAKAGDAKRAMEKYATGLASIADLLRRMEAEDMTAAEVAITQQMVMEYQKAVTAAVAEFCGNIDAEKVVTQDVEKLRQSMQGNGRRRKPMKPSDGFSVQED